ncbi:MAG: response regulator [Rhodopila sp.]|jgi:CheY-like chemotaxis protein
MNSTIIAIDDEPQNLMLIEHYLDGEGYNIKCFSGAMAALDYLRSGGAASAILLDRMMPDMDGISFIKAYRTLEQSVPVPVIMQTAAGMSSQIAEGIAAGAYYYLTKPYSQEVVRAILTRALSDHAFFQELKNSSERISAASKRIETVELAFRSLPDVNDISFFLASLYPDPQAALLGIREIMLNAVEHGNLAISYEEKTSLVRLGNWNGEVERRLNLPENIAKVASARLERGRTELVLTIEDQGQGFDPTRFMELDLRRACDPHGRGIAMARLVSFSDVSYAGLGNRVVCRAGLTPPAA